METIGVDFEIVTGVLTPAGLLQLGTVPEMPRGMRLPRAACSGSKGVRRNLVHIRLWGLTRQPRDNWDLRAAR